MRTLLRIAALMAVLPLPLSAEPDGCDPQGCRAEFRLASTSDFGSYGILIIAPDSGCGRLRFRVEGPSGDFLGHTPPLGPGQLAVVRIGQRFPVGEYLLTIVAEGCAAIPASVRKVTLAKLSPDHGWRAASMAQRSSPVG
ncbi:MAG: hypothetical protein ACK4P8_08005 [Tabrizicola sp.]